MAGASLLPVSRALAVIAKRPLPRVDLGFLGKHVPLVPRTAWADTPARPWLLRPAGGFDRLTIHHAGNGVESATSLDEVGWKLRGMLTAHTERRYGDLGYHFVVDYAGRAWEGRSLAYEGAHVSSQNAHNIGIVLQGNFELQSPSVQQVRTTRRVVALLRQRFMIKRHRIYGHRDIGHSVCPGRNMYRHVAVLRNPAIGQA